MTKSFIEMKLKQKRYRLNTADISKAYKVHQKKTPSIPVFEDRDKTLPETDDDMENTSPWTCERVKTIMIFHFFMFSPLFSRLAPSFSKRLVE